MTHPGPTFSVPVEPRNPGQFFACCGLLELAHRLWPGTEGWFEKSRFLVAHPKNGSLMDLLIPLIQCEVTRASEAATDPKTAPVLLGPPICLRLDWWLRDDGTPNLFKTWAANASSYQMFSKWRAPFEQTLAAIAAEPDQVLTISRRLQGSYGFDSDLGWDALNVGFSLNEHPGLKELPTRPSVELLGAVGLERFFPAFNASEQLVEYATWRLPLAAPVARIAVLGGLPAVTTHRLQTRFVYRGSFKGLGEAIIIQGEPNG